jgi:hypothetical protein
MSDLFVMMVSSTTAAENGAPDFPTVARCKATSELYVCIRLHTSAYVC